MTRAILYLVWWIVSGILFFYTFKQDGLGKALIAWINPLSPP